MSKFFTTFVADFGIIMEKIAKSQVKLVKSLQLKKFRDELGLFVAEGEKCVSELAKSFELVHLYREGENATRAEIEQISGLRTPQGVIGIFKKRQISNFKFQISDLALALDGIQDPGNLGTIIRTCDWFGVHDIFCSRDTADCYNPKVVQATMGALARVRIHYVDLPAWLAEQQCPIFGTLLDGKNMYDVLSSINRQSSIVQSSMSKPILLLDDIFDRLDSERVERIVEMIQGDDFGQIFITDTDRQHLTEILRPNEGAKIFHVENGQIA